MKLITTATQMRNFLVDL